MKSMTQAEAFYIEVMKLLNEKTVPFMVGGTYAFSAYANIQRPTKDLDLFTTPEDYPQILKTCSEAGFRTELLDPTWIAKVRKDNSFVDIIFTERNGLHRVTTTWLKHAREGTVLGENVKLVPVEQMIRSKSYLQFPDKYDGGDVIHLILLYGKTLDWRWLLDSMSNHWEILFAHILNFCFVYPSERDVIPQWFIEEMLKRTHELFSRSPPEEKVTQGLLISSAYNVSIEKWGFKPVKKIV